MKNVEITISSVRNDHRFIINGETVYEGDVIANFVHKPFDEWKDLLLQELYENCNDEFCIFLTSGEEEFRYIDNKRKTFPKCADIIWNGKSSNESRKTETNTEDELLNLWDELDGLSQKYGLKLGTTKKVTVGLCVTSKFMDCYSEVIDSIVSEGFSSGRLSFKCPYHNFVIEEIDDYDIDDFDGIVFLIGEDSSYNEKVIEITTPHETGLIIKETIGKKYIAPFIKGAQELEENRFGTNENAATSQTTLSVDIPEKIDVGKSQLINIVGMPKLKALELLSFEMSEAGILRYDRGRLFAIAPGKVEVRVKVKGKIEPIKRSMVEAVEHILVQEIGLKKDSYAGTVGDVYQIKPVFLPGDAENIQDVKYESMNPRIANVGTDGLLELYSTGKTKVRVSVGNVETYFSVVSELKVTKIVVSNESLKMSAGESQAFYVHVEPQCYNADFLEVSIDNDVVSYDKGIIKANSVGTATITFKSPNSNCEAKTQVSVISSNYVLARRALQSGNYSDASKFYEQIRMENPNDWEANFFAVYAKVARSEVEDISRSMELLMNNLEITLGLINSMNSDNDRISAVTAILKAVKKITLELAQKASSAHARTRTGTEHLESRGHCGESRHNCAALDYFTANTVEDVYLSIYPQLKDDVVDVWKAGIAIDVQTLQYASGQGRSVVQSDITVVTQKVRCYEPAYNAPRPTGSDSTFMDYVSFFL